MIMLSVSQGSTPPRYVLGFFSTMPLAVQASQALRDENFCLASGVSIHALDIHLTVVHLDGVLATPWQMVQDVPSTCGGQKENA